MITNIKIDNFKSLKGIDATFGPMNFIVGPNASGKSNFAEALDFVSHAISEDLSYAVAEKGGFYNICYRRQRRARGAISFAITGQISRQREMYDFTLSFQLRTRGEDIRADFYVDAEVLDVRLRDQKTGRLAGEVSIWRSENHYDIRVHRNEEGIELSARQRNFLTKCEALTPFLRTSAEAADQTLFLSGFLREYFPLSLIARELRGLRVFQLNPRIARQPAAPSVHGDLGRRGENLASAVDRMRIENERDFKKLCEWLRDVVPALAAVLTDYTETRQLGLFFQEEGFTSRWFAEDVSDGTIMSVALFFTLLDRRHKSIVIEEPETSLHPWILKKFLERCRQQSSRRQIIITTHSPLAIAQAEPAELFLIERHEGITVLNRAVDQEADLAKIIRRDFLDLGQYWLSGGLGAVPKVPDVQEEELFPPSSE